MAELEFLCDGRQDEKFTQYRCELPWKVSAAKTYPIQSPNGSNIIVCGHEYGIHVFWIGGRGFTNSVPDTSAAKAKENDDSIMIIDSDEDPVKDHNDAEEVEFAEEGDGKDGSSEQTCILQDIDIYLGTSVSDISFPYLSPSLVQGHGASLPALALKEMVIGTICSDSSIKVITLPLVPPSPARKRGNASQNQVKRGELGPWSERIVDTRERKSHRSPPTGISLSFSPRRIATGDQFSGSPIKSSQKIEEGRSRSRSRASEGRKVQEWEILVASISNDISGTLLVHHIPILSDEKDGLEHLSSKSLRHSQRHLLQTPARSIAFSPCPPLAVRHSQLLVTGSGGAIRLLEVKSPVSQFSSMTSNRPSSLNGDEAGESGSWLISLYPGFPSSSSLSNNHTTSPGARPGQRKTVLDACWVLGGKGLLALMGDGEWGIWDLEGTAFRGSSQAIINEVSRKELRGGGKTSWSLSGWVESQSTRDASQEESTVKEKESSFAPRTPFTRKTGTKTLFTSTHQNVPSTTYRGHVSSRQTLDRRFGQEALETILIEHGGKVGILPNLRSFWESQIPPKGSKPSPKATGSSIIPLTPFNLYGELLSGIDVFPNFALTGDSSDGFSPKAPSILVTAETRLILLCSDRETSPPEQREQTLALEALRHTDHEMLNTRTLDINGIDRVLTSMEHNDSRRTNGL